MVARALRQLFGLGRGGTFQVGLGASKGRGAFVAAALAPPAAVTINKLILRVITGVASGARGGGSPAAAR